MLFSADEDGHSLLACSPVDSPAHVVTIGDFFPCVFEVYLVEGESGWFDLYAHEEFAVMGVAVLVCLEDVSAVV